MEEKILWKRIQKSDNNAVKELFDLHYRPLCSYAFQFTGLMEDAEDIVQNEFIKLWTRRSELRIHTSLKAYLYKSVYNAFLHQTRKVKKQDDFLVALKYEAMSYRVDEDDTVFLEKIERIKGLLDLLPDKCREILLLSKRDGYRNREIADKLGISIKTVESQISIAFKKIRNGFLDKNLLLFIVSKKIGRRIGRSWR
tara:strand:- start:25074 stop:25664 length:591 start_codon:yes stop_codon:yes gene_type:complete